jgi:hypothetical protein
VDNWLYVCKDAGLLESSLASGLLNDNEEIRKILVTMIKNLKEKGKGNGNGEKGKPSTLTP